MWQVEWALHKDACIKVKDVGLRFTILKRLGDIMYNIDGLAIPKAKHWAIAKLISLSMWYPQACEFYEYVEENWLVFSCTHVGSTL